MVFSLPNLLTFFRLLVPPIYLYVYSAVQTPEGALFLLTLLVIAEGSDLFDGYLARRWGQVTDLGKILDPFADSLYRISIFFTLTLPPVSLPIYLVITFLYREYSISTLRTLVALKGEALQARISGKIKAVLQGTTIIAITGLLYLHTVGLLSVETVTNQSFYLTLVVAFFTLLSGAEYLVAVAKKSRRGVFNKAEVKPLLQENLESGAL